MLEIKGTESVWDTVVDALFLGDLNRFSDALVEASYERFMKAIRIREAVQRFGDADEATVNALKAVDDLIAAAREEYRELVQRIGY